MELTLRDKNSVPFRAQPSVSSSAFNQKRTQHSNLGSFSHLRTSNSPITIPLLSSLSNALPYFQPTFIRRTSGYNPSDQQMFISLLILIMKANEMHYFSNLFDKLLYMFRTCPPSIIRSISKLYTRNRYLLC
jgi:hypothetical protein